MADDEVGGVPGEADLGPAVATAARLLQDRALLAAGISLSVSDARADDFPLQWVSPAFSTTTGYSAAESVGRNCRFLQGPGTSPAAVRRLGVALVDGHDTSVTLLNYRKDGTTFWNEVSLHPVRDSTGAITHVVGVQADVSARVVAELAAQASAHRLRVAAEVGALTSTTLDSDEVLGRLVGVVVPALADWASIQLCDEDGEYTGDPVVRRAAGADPAEGCGPGGPADGELVARSRREVLRGGAPLVTDGAAGQLLVVPLVARGRVLGVLALGQDHSGRVFGREDLDVATDIGARAGSAVHNAQLYTREHEVALALQRALLPALPEVPGLLVAADYLPSTRGDQVGGDWWDVFALPDGATAIAIGDVMGHDVVAAAAMGQLRSVLRTCAWAGDAPSVVLSRMDQLVQNFEMAQLATCIYARLEPIDGGVRLRWANAGHLPPVLLRHDGDARLLPGALRVPIGVPVAPFGGGDEPQDCVHDLLPGCTVLLYTDGLVETRRGDIDEDLDRLLAVVARHRPADGPQRLVDRVVTALGAQNEDDVALLAVQVPGPAAVARR